MRIQISVDTDELRDILKELDGRVHNDTVTRMKETVEEVGKESFRRLRQDLIVRARDIYADDDLEIDEDAAISEAETHAWVSAWVYVRTTDDDDDDFDELESDETPAAA